MRIPALVIGGGLSGLAAAIRIARFSPEVVLLEKHSRLGGLNSYFYRNKKLYETGLHAITNYAEPGDKKAPLNRLLRQLKLRRKDITLCQQFQSKVVFKDKQSLYFSNEFELFQSEISEKFPACANKFQNLLNFLQEFDAFAPAPFRSAKAFLLQTLENRLLVDMILCPLMYYGSSHEDDMDLSQFAIMFRAIFQEGMFRPFGTIKDFLELLVEHLESLGGKIRTSCGVEKIFRNDSYSIVRLESGEEIECDYILSTIGYQETLRLLDGKVPSSPDSLPRLGFVETIYQLDDSKGLSIDKDSTITFYNENENFSYKSPKELVDFSSGVICFPGSFHGIEVKNELEIRSTHLASYSKWKELSSDKNSYLEQKNHCSSESLKRIEALTGKFASRITYQNSFTPVTIERYTSKIKGAIYGNPTKIKNGDIGLSNIFLAGTDQGFLGIIGSMLSGVSIVNQHILPKL